MNLGREQIAQLVPHRGSMCLLEEVLEWDAAGITCRAISHRDAANPLQTEAGLAAINGVEYAAQAAAVHSRLQENSTPRKGYLATLRDVACAVGRLDEEKADLVVRASCVAAEGGRLLYDFRIEAEGRVLVSGRLSIVLGPA